MDPAERRYLEDENTPTMKVIKGVTTGLAAGTIWGTIVATWHDVPRVERNVALPGLLRTLRMMGNYGMTFAAIGGVYIGVEQVLEHQRMKRDFINGAVGGFVAGATILGYKGKCARHIGILSVSVTSASITCCGVLEPHWDCIHIHDQGPIITCKLCFSLSVDGLIEPFLLK